MFDRPLMQPIQPAQPAAAFVALDSAPLVLGWLLTQTSHHATAHHPDRGGHVAGRQQNVTGGEAAHFDVRWQQLVQVEVLCQGGRHHESERRSEYRLSAVSPGLICRWICSRTVARSGRVPGNWSRERRSLWPRAHGVGWASRCALTFQQFSRRTGITGQHLQACAEDFPGQAGSSPPPSVGSSQRCGFAGVHRALSVGEVAPAHPATAPTLLPGLDRCRCPVEHRELQAVRRELFDRGFEREQASVLLRPSRRQGPERTPDWRPTGWRPTAAGRKGLPGPFDQGHALLAGGPCGLQ